MRGFFRLDDEHPFTGWHMLAAVIAFFGVVIAVNVVMAVAATGTFPGLVVRNSYVASQNYNALLANARAQAEAGWRLELDAPEGILAARLLGGDGALRRDLDVTAVAGRPSTTRHDSLIALAETADGYRASEALPPGLWEVEVEARHRGELVFREVRRVTVRPAEPD
jgi:nitrogen fixation protein FixH